MATLATIDGDLAESSDGDGALRRAVRLLVVVGALLLIWGSAGNHPLHSPDEGRYGTVSATMVDAPSWLVPTFRGAPHLTKPPLIYWLQAASMRALGVNELALRLPSLIAASLSVLVLWWFVRRVRGPDMAALAVGLYGVMPLPLLFGRLATTDAVLNFCWLSALACTVLALESRPRRTASIVWLAIAWAFVGVAALDKGPVAPAPMVIVATWLALARRWADLRWFALHAVWGALLALAPIGAWAWAIVERHPEAWRIWREQFIDRAIFGSPPQALMQGVAADSDRADAEPFWFYLPIVLAGFFPATCALVLPWFNMRLREALRAFTRGDLRALLLVAVVGPILFFSMARGKMPSYVMPIGAPLAILVAGTLARWCGLPRSVTLSGNARVDSNGIANDVAVNHAVVGGDAPLAIDRPPDVRFTFLVVVFLAVVGGVFAGVLLGGAEGAILVLPFAFMPVAAFVVMMLWNHGDAARRIGLVIGWLILVLALMRLERIEDIMLTDRDMGARGMVERMRREMGTERPQFVIYSFRNPTIDFYARREPLMVWSVGDLRAVWPKLEPEHVILISRERYEWMVREYPRLAEVLVPIHGTHSGRAADDASDQGDADGSTGHASAGGARAAIWNRWAGKPTVLLRMTRQADMDEADPPTPRTREPRE